MAELTVEQVEALEDEHLAALVAHDLDALDRLHADDRVHVHYDGRREDKDEYFAPLRRREVSYVDLTPYGERNIRVDGATGVVTGDLAWSAELAGGETVSGRIAFSSVWVDRGQGAVQVLWHSSPTPRAPEGVS